MSISIYLCLLFQVSLDSRVREVINRNMVDPTPHTFDEAQLQIFTLMHRDSYPRFLNSQIYKKLLQQCSWESHYLLFWYSCYGVLYSERETFKTVLPVRGGGAEADDYRTTARGQNIGNILFCGGRVKENGMVKSDAAVPHSPLLESRKERRVF